MCVCSTTESWRKDPLNKWERASRGEERKRLKFDGGSVCEMLG